MASAGLTLRRVDMPSWELGFRQSPASPPRHTHGSRAVEAGLRVGKRVVQTSDINQVAAELERKLTVLVQRFHAQGIQSRGISGLELGSLIIPN